jgi:hypothetical protein
MSELEVVLTVSVAPPSVVITSWLPAVTVRRHSLAVAQSIELNELPTPIGRVAQVLPPSVDFSSVPGPIA